MFLKKFEVKDKTALVTGAGKGIGKASAIALAEAGANLIIISRTEKDLIAVKNQIKKIKRKCNYFVCDVTNLKEIKKIFSKINKSIKEYTYFSFCRIMVVIVNIVTSH